MPRQDGASSSGACFDSSRKLGGAGHLGRHRRLDGAQDAAAGPELGDAHLAQLLVAQQRQHVNPDARPAKGALELLQAVGRQPRAQGGVGGAARQLLQRWLTSQGTGDQQCMYSLISVSSL